MRATKEGPFPMEGEVTILASDFSEEMDKKFRTFEEKLEPLPAGFYYDLTVEHRPFIKGGDKVEITIIATPKMTPEYQEELNTKAFMEEHPDQPPPHLTCPFCGGKASEVWIKGKDDPVGRPTQVYWVKCIDVSCIASEGTKRVLVMDGDRVEDKLRECWEQWDRRA